MYALDFLTAVLVNSGSASRRFNPVSKIINFSQFKSEFHLPLAALIFGDIMGRYYHRKYTSHQAKIFHYPKLTPMKLTLLIHFS